MTPRQINLVSLSSTELSRLGFARSSRSLWTPPAPAPARALRRPSLYVPRARALARPGLWTPGGRMLSPVWSEVTGGNPMLCADGNPADACFPCSPPDRRQIYYCESGHKAPFSTTAPAGSHFKIAGVCAVVVDEPSTDPAFVPSDSFATCSDCLNGDDEPSCCDVHEYCSGYLTLWLVSWSFSPPCAGACGQEGPGTDLYSRLSGGSMLMRTNPFSTGLARCVIVEAVGDPDDPSAFTGSANLFWDGAVLRGNMSVSGQDIHPPHTYGGGVGSPANAIAVGACPTWTISGQFQLTCSHTAEGQTQTNQCLAAGTATFTILETPCCRNTNGDCVKGRGPCACGSGPGAMMTSAASRSVAPALPCTTCDEELVASVEEEL